MIPFLESGKPRLREVKDLPRDNGSKEKTCIQDIMTPNSRLSTATLHVVSMAVTAPLVWNYYFTLRYFQSIFSLHMSLPTSHHRVFITTILMLLDSRPCVLHITNDRKSGFPQFSGASFLEEVLLKMQVVTKLVLLQVSCNYHHDHNHHHLLHLQPGGVTGLVFTNRIWMEGKWVYSRLRHHT